jgi:hypothetical protein
MQAHGRNQRLTETEPRGVDSLESTIGNGPLLPTTPLPSNLPQSRRRSSNQSERLDRRAAIVALWKNTFAETRGPLIRAR